MRKNKVSESLEPRTIKNPLEYSYKEHFSKLPLSFYKDLTDFEKKIWRALHYCTSGMILKKSKHRPLSLDDFKKLKTEKKVEMSAETRQEIAKNLAVPIGRLSGNLNFIAKGSVIFILDSRFKNNRIKN